MKQRQLIQRLARKANVSEAVAADTLDQVLHRILSRLRRKQEAEVPGIARLLPESGGKLTVCPPKEGKERGNAGS